MSSKAHLGKNRRQLAEKRSESLRKHTGDTGDFLKLWAGNFHLISFQSRRRKQRATGATVSAEAGGASFNVPSASTTLISYYDLYFPLLQVSRRWTQASFSETKHNASILLINLKMFKILNTSGTF